MTKQKIEIDPITAMLLKQNAEALEAYGKFFQMGGDLRKYIDEAKPKTRTNYISATPKTYEKLKQSVAFSIGLQLERITDIAAEIKTEEVRVEYEYWDSWRFCAQTVPDHPDRPAREKFCQDYRANEPVENCIHYYRIGDMVCSQNLLEGCYFGKVIAIEDNQMRIEMAPNDRRRKKKEIVVETNDLRVFPLSMERRKEKPNE